ncbi:MAG: hypothetical protein ACLGH3_06745 [Actinomycetota bacterium]
MYRFASFALAVSLTACGGATDGSRLEVTLTDFSFKMRATTTPGPVLVEAVNRGETMHEIRVFALEGSKGLADAQAYFEDGGGSPADWMKPIAEMSIINPGIRSGFVADLSDPGTYLFACTFPDSEFTLHAARGMLATLEVDGQPSGRVAPEPQTTIRIGESAPTVPELTSGRRLVAFQNMTAVPADVSIMSSNEAAIDEFEDWVGNGQVGDPPLTTYGGGSVPPGQIRIFEVDLPPGQYRLLTTLRHSSDDLEDRFTELTVI